MSIEDVNKNIRQMSQVFLAAGVVNILLVIIFFFVSLDSYGDPSSDFWLTTVVALISSGLLFAANSNLNKREPAGHKLAMICSVIFVISFPVYTIFGISYLRKLSSPEIQHALGVGGHNHTVAVGIKDVEAISIPDWTSGKVPSKQISEATPNIEEDPVGKLEFLKGLLDSDLITKHDYETKKREILSNM